MRLIVDFHIHSKYSRATSINISVENLAKYAKIKGINVLGTGDFTHPQWLKELKAKLCALGNGLFEYDETLYVLSGEVSNVFTVEGKVKKIHDVILAPSFEITEQINEQLKKSGILEKTKDIEDTKKNIDKLMILLEAQYEFIMNIAENNKKDLPYVS